VSDTPVHVTRQVIVVTLDVIGLVMLKADSQTAKSHVRQVATFLVPRMLDPNMMVRRAVMQLAMRLMQSTSPVVVIDILSDNIRHRSPRVRQLTVDILTAALLTYPRSNFDLPALCATAAPALVDQKKGVRHAAMECVAVIAQVGYCIDRWVRGRACCLSRLSSCLVEKVNRRQCLD